MLLMLYRLISKCFTFIHTSIDYLNGDCQICPDLYNPGLQLLIQRNGILLNKSTRLVHKFNYWFMITTGQTPL